MKKLLALISLTAFLNGCGGGGSPSTNNPNVPGGGNSGSDKSFWHKPIKKFNLIFDRFSFSGDSIYASNFNRMTLKTDGTVFKLFKNTYDDLDAVNFVDRHGRQYLYNTYTDDGFNFIKDPNYKGVGEYCTDSESMIACGYIKPYLRTNQGFSSVDIQHSYTKGTYQDVLSFTEPASNGINTFILPLSKSGLTISTDNGLNWKYILEDKYSFTAVAGNINHSNHVFAGRVGELYTSSDTGVNWHKVSAPTYEGKRVVNWVDLELLDDGELIALTEMENESGNNQYLFKSSDFGKTWAFVNKERSFFDNIEANDNFYFASPSSGSLSIAPR